MLETMGIMIPKISDKKWHRGEGVNPNSGITTTNNKNMCEFLIFACFWSTRQQLSFG